MSLHGEVVHSMGGDGLLVGAVTSTGMDLWGVHTAHQVEMEGILVNLECLEQDENKLS